ncbi:hypothetical protein GQ473_05740 [archaeon]|nr:hypothetical protein [archaeon]
MKLKRKKGLMAMPAVVLFMFTFAVVAIALALITAKEVIVTKEYVLNETRANTILYIFLIDNTCSKTQITNAELLSLGIMQQKKADEEIELNYNGIEDTTIFENCIVKFMENIEHENNYYFSATDTKTIMNVGNINTKGKKTITYIPTLNDEQIKITLVMQYD